MSSNKKIKCLIIDDEPLAREILKIHIAGVNALELTGTCSNALEALSFLNEHQVDLLFLDIQMPHLLGTNFIRTLKKTPKVIFTTAYRKYAVQGFELDAVDYILKPISFERFLKAVNKVMQLDIASDRTPPAARETFSDQHNSFLYFRVERKMVKVFFNEILFIESLKDYVRIVTKSKPVVTKYVLAALHELLPSDEFLQIHKSYIVAINKIESYDADCVRILNHELPIGRFYKHDVTKILKASSAS